LVCRQLLIATPPPFEHTPVHPVSLPQRRRRLFSYPPQCYTRPYHPREPPHARPEGQPCAALVPIPRVIVCPPLCPGWQHLSMSLRRRKGELMTEEGTLSIVRRGQRYQVRYASNNPHGRERLPRVCPDEVHLEALLHHFGAAAAAMTQVCAAVRQGKMAVLLVVVSAEQLQTFFPLTPQAHAWTGSAYPASVSPPVAAVVRHDSQSASSSQPRSHALWIHAREVRGEAEQRLEEFALLLEEAALLLEETTLAVAASHQLQEAGHV